MKKDILISSVETKNLSNDYLLSISEIEKDMWAYGIGEYVECNNCGLIHSKKDIYGHLETNIKNESVTKLENILGWDSIKCNDCNSDTSFIFDLELYLDEIQKRYTETNGFLTIASLNDRLVGFIDGYISNFDLIYKRELSHYYSEIEINKLKYLINQKISGTLTNNIFSFSSMGTLEKNRSIFIMFELIKTFFNSIPEEYNNILGISELVLGSTTDIIYNSMGAIELGVGNLSNNRHLEYKSDIFLQENVVLKYKKNFNVSVKEFLKNNKKTLKKY